MLHNVSPRKLIFLSAGPLIADLLPLMVLCLMNIQAVRMGVPPKFQAWIGSAYALAYAISSHFAGRWIKPRHAMVLLVISLIVAAIAGTGAALWRPATPQPGLSMAIFLVVSAISGAALGHYFVPFQIKMGRVKPFSTLAWTVGYYNICWSTGYAAGVFGGTFLRNFSPLYLISAAWALALLHMALAVLAGTDRSPDNENYHPSEAFASTPALRYCGWLGIFLANFVICGVMVVLWPGLGSRADLTDLQIALGLLAMGAALPLSNLIWPLLRRAMTRPHMIAVLMVVLAGAVMMLPFVRWPLAIAPLFLTGLAVAGLFYHTVYYSNGDPDRAGRSIGISEFCVGLGGVIGPLAAGSLAWNDAASLRPYVASAALSLAAAVAVLWIWKRNGKPAAASPAAIDAIINKR